MGEYYKAIVSVLVAAGGAIALGLDGDSFLSTAEWIAAALAVLGSGGVTWYVAYGPGSRYAKEVVAALGLALGSLAIAIQDDVITQAEWVTAIVAGLGGLIVVGAVPGPTSASVGNPPSDL